MSVSIPPVPLTRPTTVSSASRLRAETSIDPARPVIAAAAKSVVFTSPPKALERDGVGQTLGDVDDADVASPDPAPVPVATDSPQGLSKSPERSRRGGAEEVRSPTLRSPARPNGNPRRVGVAAATTTAMVQTSPPASPVRLPGGSTVTSSMATFRGTNAIPVEVAARDFGASAPRSEYRGSVPPHPRIGDEMIGEEPILVSWAAAVAGNEGESEESAAAPTFEVPPRRPQASSPTPPPPHRPPSASKERWEEVRRPMSRSRVGGRGTPPLTPMSRPATPSAVANAEGGATFTTKNYWQQQQQQQATTTTARDDQGTGQPPPIPLIHPEAHHAPDDNVTASIFDVLYSSMPLLCSCSTTRYPTAGEARRPSPTRATSAAATAAPLSACYTTEDLFPTVARTVWRRSVSQEQQQRAQSQQPQLPQPFPVTTCVTRYSDIPSQLSGQSMLPPPSSSCASLLETSASAAGGPLWCAPQHHHKSLDLSHREFSRLVDSVSHSLATSATEDAVRAQPLQNSAARTDDSAAHNDSAACTVDVEDICAPQHAPLSRFLPPIPPSLLATGARGSSQSTVRSTAPSERRGDADEGEVVLDVRLEEKGPAVCASSTARVQPDEPHRDASSKRSPSPAPSNASSFFTVLSDRAASLRALIPSSESPSCPNPTNFSPALTRDICSAMEGVVPGSPPPRAAEKSERRSSPAAASAHSGRRPAEASANSAERVSPAKEAMSRLRRSEEKDDHVVLDAQRQRVAAEAEVIEAQLRALERDAHESGYGFSLQPMTSYDSQRFQGAKGRDEPSALGPAAVPPFARPPSPSFQSALATTSPAPLAAAPPQIETTRATSRSTAGRRPSSSRSTSSARGMSSGSSAVVPTLRDLLALAASGTATVASTSPAPLGSKITTPVTALERLAAQAHSPSPTSAAEYPMPRGALATSAGFRALQATEGAGCVSSSSQSTEGTTSSGTTFSLRRCNTFSSSSSATTGVSSLSSGSIGVLQRTPTTPVNAVSASAVSALCAGLRGHTRSLLSALIRRDEQASGLVSVASCIAAVQDVCAKAHVSSAAPIADVVNRILRQHVFSPGTGDTSTLVSYSEFVSAVVELSDDL